MQLKWKNVLSLKINLLFFFLIVSLPRGNAQKISSSYDSNQFILTENNKVLYIDSLNFLTGMCTEIKLIPSKFNNQFYFYKKYFCVESKLHLIFKVLWLNNEFIILETGFYAIERSAISSKITQFVNYKIDSLILDDIDGYGSGEKDENQETKLYLDQNLIGKIRYKKNSLINFDQFPIDNYSNVKSNIKLYEQIANSRMLNKAYDEALFIFLKILKNNASNPKIVLNIADCYYQLYDMNNSQINYDKYVKIMRRQKNSTQIPQYVYERLKE